MGASCRDEDVASYGSGRLKGAVDRELGGEYIGIFQCFLIVFIFVRNNHFSSTLFEDPSCTKCNK